MRRDTTVTQGHLDDIFVGIDLATRQHQSLLVIVDGAKALDTATSPRHSSVPRWSKAVTGP